VTQLQASPSGALVPYAVPVAATGTSTATSVSVSLSVPAFAGTAFIQSSLTTVPFPVILTLAGMQLLTASPGGAAATMGISGNQLTKSMVPIGATLLEIPSTVGVSGFFTGTLTLTGSARKAFLSRTWWRWARSRSRRGGAGTVTLVSPSRSRSAARCTTAPWRA
jgi:hypothetical protein